MVSSDIKSILRKVLTSIKREELGEIVQEWAVLSRECSQKIINMVDSSSRLASRRTIVQTIVDDCMQQKIHKKQISQLDLICCISHPERKKWEVYELKHSETDSQKKAFDPHAYFRNVTKHLSAYFKHDLCMDQREDAIWLRIGIYEGGRNNPVTILNNAVFVVYHPHSNYLIMSRIKKGLVDFIMQAMIQALGCSSCKETKLTGHHLDSLAELTLNSASQGWFSKFRLNQVDTNPLVKTRPKKRKGDSLALEDRSLLSENVEEEERCQQELDGSFGPNKQPRLEKICYEMEIKFRGTRTVPSMATRLDPFRCSVKFEGPNVLEGLKQMRPYGISTVTLPHLFEQVLTTSKNHFRIYDKLQKKDS